MGTRKCRVTHFNKHQPPGKEWVRLCGYLSDSCLIEPLFDSQCLTALMALGPLTPVGIQGAAQPCGLPCLMQVFHGQLNGAPID